jgi:addiction module RelE/StbE family toxin
VIPVRWTEGAYNNLETIAHYLFENSPENAEQLIRRIHETTAALDVFANRGRPGKTAGTRELPVPSLPYVVVYRVETDAVILFRILHTAQNWPTSA